jgi:uncharacterized membrane protein HdeD (DUF308 family)
MNKSLFVSFYGAIIIVESVFLLFSKFFTFNTTKYILGIALLIGAILAIVTALYRKRKQVQFAYHEMHALAMFVYGISVLLFASTIEILSYLTAFLLFFYAFSEIIFCSWLFHLKNRVKFNILFIRVFLGLMVGIGTIVVMTYYAINKEMVMQGYGILFAIIGLNILLYVPIMKTTELQEALE